MPQISVRIDSELYSATEGQTIYQVAAENGRSIPSLCHMEGLSSPGSCRMCLVEVAGVGRQVPACTTPAQSGMSVTTNSEALAHNRLMALELLFIERNHICAVCVSNGNCELQSLAQTLGLTHVRFPYNYPRLPVDVSHPRWVLDHNRCILCSRCVRVCDEIEGANVWDISARGISSLEMPSITARICGICPISHLITSAKACEAIMCVTVPPTAVKLREIMHCGQIIQSHALSFFHLSSPDLLLGFDSDPARRNLFGVIADHPEIASDGISLRRFGQQAIEGVAGERIHPSWTVPGGVNSPLDPVKRDRILAGLPAAKATALRTLGFFKGILDKFSDEIAVFGNSPTMYAGLVDDDDNLQLYDGGLRFVDASGEVVVDRMPAEDYAQYIGEATVPHSFLKSPYFKPRGFPEGTYRVGPLARLNVVARCGTQAADIEFDEYHQRFGKVVQSAFHFHYARLIEIIYSLERMETLLNDPAILGRHVRAHAGVNALEGIGMAEAPRGVLTHHYKVNEDGAMVWANLIIATGHNNLSIGRSINQVSRHFVDGKKMKEGMLNRVSAVLRAYDPCLSCSTHASNPYSVEVELVDTDGSVVDSIRR